MATMTETELFKKSITLPNDVQEVPKLSEFVDGVCEAMDIDMAQR